MDSRSSEKPIRDLRDHLAEERTFLAWIRTGIALIGLGFVIARFGPLAQEPRVAQHASGAHIELALWFGTALILTGVVVNLVSAWRHVRLVDRSDRDLFARRFLSVEAVVVALLLALLGTAATICLILLAQ
jgi:putative membrane protein